MSVGRVGPPLRCNDLRLINWDEGNYTVDDNPLPRGELIIGGDNVALGYFKVRTNRIVEFGWKYDFEIFYLLV